MNKSKALTMTTHIDDSPLAIHTPKTNEGEF